MSTFRRFVRFNVVGAAGVGLQLGTLAALVHGANADYRLATATALAVTLVHNFLWHVRWTWRDSAIPPADWPRAFLRFVGANGVVSIAGTAVLMPLFVGVAGVPAVAANALTICACGLVNYGLALRVFSGSSRTGARRQSLPSEAA